MLRPQQNCWVVVSCNAERWASFKWRYIPPVTIWRHYSNSWGTAVLDKNEFKSIISPTTLYQRLMGLKVRCLSMPPLDKCGVSNPHLLVDRLTDPQLTAVRFFWGLLVDVVRGFWMARLLFRSFQTPPGQCGLVSLKLFLCRWKHKKETNKSSS